MEHKEAKQRGTDEPFLSFMAIGGSAVLKLLGVSAEEAANYHFRAVVLKQKSLKPDVECIPVLEGRGRRVYIEFQGYRYKFVRYNLMAKVMMGCEQDDYEGDVLAGIVYTDMAYKDAALPINVFAGTSDSLHTCCFTEVVLTDYTEEQLRAIDPRLVVLAPFTVSSQADRGELAQRGRMWKKEIEKVYPADLHKEALDVVGLFLLNRFRNITREEVVSMLNFDLMETKAGQEVYEEGREEGMLKDAREMVVDALEEHFGIVPIVIADKIHALGRRELLKSLHKQAMRCKNIEEFLSLLEKT